MLICLLADGGCKGKEKNVKMTAELSRGSSSIAVYIENNTDKRFTISSPFWLQEEKNGEWQASDANVTQTIVTVAYNVDVGDSFTDSFPVDASKMKANIRYRVYVHCMDYSDNETVLYSEPFTINDDKQTS